jgi:hypothetical protein
MSLFYLRRWLRCGLFGFFAFGALGLHLGSDGLDFLGKPCRLGEVFVLLGLLHGDLESFHFFQFGVGVICRSGAAKNGNEGETKES